MIDKKVRNKNLLKKIIQIILVTLAAICGDLASDWWFDGVFIWQCVITIIIVIIITPLIIWIENRIDEK